MLFLTILFLCFFLTFGTDIIKFLKIAKLFSPKQVNALPGLQEDLSKARLDWQSLMRSNSSLDQGNYTFAIKKMRAEQKIKDLQTKIRNEQLVGQLKGTSAELVLSYGLRAVLYIILVTISIRNRYNPVLIFNDKFNFEPLQGLLTFPTGVPNAVSVPVWVLSCNVTFRLFSRIIKQM